MLADGTLREAITRLLVDQMHLAVPSHDADLLETAVLDSMGLVDLLVHLEKAFGVSIGVEELDFDHFRSVASIAAMVGARMRTNNGGSPSRPVADAQEG